MHSFISNSRARAPKESSLTILLIASFVAIGLLGIFEWRLREAGFVPNVRDSMELWAAQRQRASRLGKRALILVGASRLQLAIDIDALRDATGLEPVQLAIDGSSNLPVLEDLANDSSVTGTILVSTNARLMLPISKPDRANEWIEFYNESFRGLYSPMLEARLKSLVMEYSALYSSAIPLNLVLSMVSGQRRTNPLYLITKENRERIADYQLVKMPEFYIARVLRHLGAWDNRLEIRTMGEFNQTAFSAVESLPTQDNSDYLSQLADVYTLVRQIEERGGKVGFLRMPTDKWVWEIDEKKYPRTEFWDLFASNCPALTFHFKDYAGLNEFNLPDGSHIDKRDKRRFTTNLAQILGQRLLQK